MAFPFPKNIVLKMSVSKNYHFLIHFHNSVFQVQDKSLFKFLKINIFSQR